MATLYFTGNGTQWDTLANWWTNSARTIQATSLPLPTDDIDAIMTGSFAYSATPIVANSAIFRGTTVNICFARSLNIATTVTFIGLYNTFPVSSSFSIHQLSTGVNEPLTITADTLILSNIGMGWAQTGRGGAVYKCGGTASTVAPVTLDVNNLQILNNCIVGPLGPSLTIKNNCNITIGKKYNIVSSTNTSPISITLDSPHYFTNDLSNRQIFIQNHAINTNANLGSNPSSTYGLWNFTVTGPNTLTLDGSIGNGVGGNTGQAMYRDDSRQGLCSVNTGGGAKPIIGNNFNIVCNGTTGFANGGLDAGELGILFASNNHNITLNDRAGTQKNIITCTNNIIMDGNRRGKFDTYPRLFASTINANIDLRGGATPYSSYETIINGNIICSQSVYPNNPIDYGGTVHNGNISFTSSTPVIFRLTGNETWYYSLALASATFTAAGDPTIEFNDTSRITTSEGQSLNYNAVFNDSSYIPATNPSWPYNAVVATIGGDVTFNDSSYLLGSLVTSNQSIISFNNNSFNAGKISGGASINYNGFTGTNSYGSFINGQRRTSINIPITVTNNATFNGVSLNQNTLTGNATFNNFSGNSGTITGDATFTASSFSGSPSSFVGTITGTTTFSSNTVVTFTLNNSESWDRDSSIWIFSTPNPVWIFNDTSYNNNIINGNCTFNNSSYNTGTIAGICVFNNSSYNGDDISYFGYITGNCIFNNSSYNSATGSVNGNCTFNNTAVNKGPINGIARLNDTSHMRDYASATSSIFKLSAASTQLSNSYYATFVNFGSISFEYEKGINGSSILGLV